MLLLHVICANLDDLVLYITHGNLAVLFLHVTCGSLAILVLNVTYGNLAVLLLYFTCGHLTVLCYALHVVSWLCWSYSSHGSICL